jgi:hypothetical protein
MDGFQRTNNVKGGVQSVGHPTQPFADALWCVAQLWKQRERYACACDGSKSVLGNSLEFAGHRNHLAYNDI